VTIPREEPVLSAAPVEGRILQDGRSKAYRPLSLERRRAAFAAGIAAYDAGDFFEAHELLEPAWMGSDDLVERELEQGLIKLAAAYVHAVRGNARGVATNLTGARTRLSHAADEPRIAEVLERLQTPDLDVSRLVEEVDERLDVLGKRLQQRGPRARGKPAEPPASAPEERPQNARAILATAPPPVLREAHPFGRPPEGMPV
jgi:hypothetical protein